MFYLSNFIIDEEHNNFAVTLWVALPVDDSGKLENKYVKPGVLLFAEELTQEWGDTSSGFNELPKWKVEDTSLTRIEDTYLTRVEPYSMPNVRHKSIKLSRTTSLELFDYVNSWIKDIDSVVHS